MVSRANPYAPVPAAHGVAGAVAGGERRAARVQRWGAPVDDTPCGPYTTHRVTPGSDDPAGRMGGKNEKHRLMTAT